MRQKLVSALSSLGTAARLMLVFTLLLGVLYPLSITAAGQWLFPAQANGSLLRNGQGQVLGSALIAKSYTDPAGDALPQYFQPRPSANDYDALASGGSNLGPENPELVKQILLRKTQLAKFNQVPEDQIPPDALTASGSGLDPEISPANAQMQSSRVARARGLSAQQVQQLVREHTTGPTLGFVGQERVNVVELNAALDELG
ncbi:potassium-transporting ATPase KdpC subunit [Glutamicibacter uratoxydans]|uniref:Potassium-transporting ATPase KdpC subunit n=1 Tax=Glutamicibacter uratoxydans TaxID=43667 RepID=A0A4Y4DQY0_GLUUR|nr:potassium-transporting ATPase subunit KdpC [Glutamicibacter uratoxydans]GED05930.1 potassium-transporting ATPase KdpC subunit [Glutamicibacter uratoxydans]